MTVLLREPRPVFCAVTVFDEPPAVALTSVRV
jgi:hypothetical protein